MAGLNDLSYAIGTSTYTIASAGGTVLIPEVAGAVRRDIWHNGGTMYLHGASQAIGISNAVNFPSNVQPMRINGPAAFILIAGTNNASVTVMTHFSQNGIPNTSRGT